MERVIVVSLLSIVTGNVSLASCQNALKMQDDDAPTTTTTTKTVEGRRKRKESCREKDQTDLHHFSEWEGAESLVLAAISGDQTLFLLFQRAIAYAPCLTSMEASQPQHSSNQYST